MAANEVKFTLRIKHGGSISKASVPKYVRGHTAIFKNMGYDEWGMMTIKDKLEEIGYGMSSIVQVFCMFDNGLKELISDYDAWDVVNEDDMPNAIELWVVESCSDSQGGERADGVEQEAIPSSIMASEILPSEIDEPLFNSSDENSLCSSSDEEAGNSKPPVFKPKRDMHSPPLQVGLVFATRKDFRQAIINYGLEHGKEIEFPKNDKLRMYDVCTKEGCPWRIDIRKEQDNPNFRVSYFHDEHDVYCIANNHNKLAKSSILAKRWAKELKFNSKWTPSEFSRKLADDEGLYLSYKKLFYTLKKAKALNNGDEEAEFKKLWSYCEEIKRTNPNSSVVVHCFDDEDGNMRFQRLFMCWEACREGFKYCRNIIGIDGTHLSGKFGGVMLTAIALDGNESIFPLAYAVVEGETKESWTWFLDLLSAEFGLQRIQRQITFMSDKQKGLIQAFNEVLPYVIHIFCVRHLHGNMKQYGHTGNAIRNHLWEAARSSTIPSFSECIKAFKEFDIDAYNWLAQKHPTEWAKSHFDVNCKSDTLVNNFRESFNHVIKDARQLPTIQCLEAIREKLMKIKSAKRMR